MRVIDTLKKKFQDRESLALGQERDKLGGELSRLKAQTLREDVHREIDVTFAELRAANAREIAGAAGAFRAGVSAKGNPEFNIARDSIRQLAVDTFAVSDAFVAAVHAAIDADERFSPMPAAERAEKVAKLKRQVAEVEAELQRRALDVEQTALAVEISGRLEAIAAKATGKDAG